MIPKRIRGIGPLLLTAALALPLPAAAQGVPTIDLTSIAKIGEVLTEAKLQVREMIASNLKLDEQILKQIEQIATLKAQLDALRNGLTLEALGIPLPKDGKAIEDYGNRIFRNPGFVRSLTDQEKRLREIPV